MSRKTDPRGVIAVAIHDVEPATWERCALIRDWLEDHGVDRVTLLVIPARDLHPVGQRCPEMSDWLRERRDRGDSIAQHGFLHEPLGAGPSAGRRLGPLGARRSEFAGLDEREARRAVDAGWRILKLSGNEPDGFVAPGYAYTPQLLRVLPRRFRWWATLLRVRPCPTDRPAAAGTPDSGLTPAWGAGSRGRLGDALAPALIRAGGRLAGHSLRVDLHPATLDRPREMLALESLLTRESDRRRPVTLGEVFYPTALKIEGASGLAAERPA
jgi:predicted deacetylase